MGRIDPLASVKVLSGVWARGTLAIICLAIMVTISAPLVMAEAPYQVAWSHQIGTSRSDLSNSVAVDPYGNAYISGGTSRDLFGTNAGDNDPFLVKYDASGNVLWSRQTGTASDDMSCSVAVDTSGNAYISGYTSGSFGGTNAGELDAFLTKFDGSGNVAWSRQIGTTRGDASYSVAVGASGSVYITGETQGSLGGNNAGTRDAFLVKYDRSGNLLWSRQVGTPNNDISHSVAVDASDNAYICGYTTGSLFAPNAGGCDAFLTKYDASGSVLWSKQIGTLGYDSSNSVAVDGSGNVYMSGQTNGSLFGPIGGGTDAFLTKYDASGNMLWSRQVGTASGECSTSVALDAQGNIYIGGVTNNTADLSTADAFLMKFGASGNMLWSQEFSSSNTDYIMSVALDASGAPYVTGVTMGSLFAPNVGDWDAFVVKFEPIPEPGTLALLALGGLAVLRRGSGQVLRRRSGRVLRRRNTK